MALTNIILWEKWEPLHTNEDLSLCQADALDGRLVEPTRLAHDVNRIGSEGTISATFEPQP